MDKRLEEINKNQPVYFPPEEARCKFSIFPKINFDWLKGKFTGFQFNFKFKI